MEDLWTDDSDAQLDRQVEEFALNAQFRTWVLNPTPESEAYWTDYLFLHPDQAEAVRQARTLTIALQVPHYSLSEEAVSARTERLLHRIRTHQISDKPTVIRLVSPQVWRWAAAAVVVLSLGWWGYQKLAERPATIAVRHVNERPSLPTEAAGTVMEEVTHATERRVTLPDGSVVTLAPYSYLRYALPFGKTDRTVALTGQAFFNVIPNTHSPFFVFTDAVVTRVLGTSFTVMNRTGQLAKVIVRTGRVSVYNRQTFKTGSKASTMGLVLVPNQQATFQQADGLLIRSLIEKPLPLPNKVVNTLDFENQPVSEVIDALVKTYGIPITYDQERLGRCRVTVTLEKEPLFDQLALLSKLLDGRYEVIDATIYLYADGCR